MRLYPWVVYLHVAGVFGFLVAHGVSVGVAFKVRKERDAQRILALLQLSASSIGVMYISTLVLLAGGILAGFLGPDQEFGGLSWWGYGWIWVALGTFLATILAMGAVASPYYRRLRTVAEAMSGGSQAVSQDRLAEVLGGPRPWLLAGIGFGSILFILYLMMFKPF